MSRQRLDNELVRRGLVENRSQAQEVIKAGRVTVDGAPANKPSRMVALSQSLFVAGDPPRYVSRGGLKLEAALDFFDINVSGLQAIDVGSSTGGFTDCLLQHDAISVTAIDVGRGQLHNRLFRDKRVTVYERTNIRHVEPEEIGAPFDLLVADLSFISLTAILANLLDLVGDKSSMLLLVKPQFEAGKDEVDKGKGVIRNPEVWNDVLNKVQMSVRGNKAAIIEGMVSPITGAEGNVEFFIRVVKSSDCQRLVIPSLVKEAIDLHGDGEK
ncbi:MAG: 16S/23S rRNA (cytidine-2'-O)-methyltransferase TlyA [Acidimicrobiales bacterium AG-410-I20]|nr:MAG: 16S/23S rRNA (cytidine-2'-O)-methyltransferase TlyA [Acidimicrobiales bacterium AG-410-I20]